MVDVKDAQGGEASSILLSVLAKVVVPEILVAIRAHHNATGNLPTEDQVIAALNLDADRIIRLGGDFLARTT